MGFHLGPCPSVMIYTHPQVQILLGPPNRKWGTWTTVPCLQHAGNLPQVALDGCSGVPKSRAARASTPVTHGWPLFTSPVPLFLQLVPASTPPLEHPPPISSSLLLSSTCEQSWEISFLMLLYPEEGSKPSFQRFCLLGPLYPYRPRGNLLDASSAGLTQQCQPCHHVSTPAGTFPTPVWGLPFTQVCPLEILLSNFLP